MKANKIISINPTTNNLVLEIEDEVVTKLNETIYIAELMPEYQLRLYGDTQQFEIEDIKERNCKLLRNSGFLQVHARFFINSNFINRIQIEEHQIELVNDVSIPYTVEYEKNIENFLRSVSTINF